MITGSNPWSQFLLSTHRPFAKTCHRLAIWIEARERPEAFAEKVVESDKEHKKELQHSKASCGGGNSPTLALANSPLIADRSK